MNRVYEAEQLRENGMTELAIDILNGVIQEANSLNNTEVLAQALGHRIVCNKHLYQAAHGLEHKYRYRMRADIFVGIGLDMDREKKAVFYLRCGDTCMMVHDFMQAEQWYETAYRCLPKGSQDAPEYFGHLADAKVELGDYEAALRILEESLSIIRLCRDLRSFHRHIVVAGLYARQIKAANKAGQHRLAIAAFCKGYSLALWLALRHNMPMRMKQYHAAIKERHK